MKRIIAVCQGVLDVVASRESLDAKNVIQMQAFVTGNSVGWRNEKE
jgi:hypothetical protein